MLQDTSGTSVVENASPLIPFPSASEDIGFGEEDYNQSLDPGVEASEELDPGDTSESENVIEVQDNLNNHNDLESDTTGINADRFNLIFEWHPRENLSMDPNFIQWLLGLVGPHIGTRPGTRLVLPVDGRPPHEIEVSDLA
ncbi:hypothetical protein K438DRAFT_1762155 [Mycena galopus ATCC 62051]|nr:hypothetical protein K438DRAFT_1762155 [Mycena galopus ATCC 62051]